MNLWRGNPLQEPSLWRGIAVSLLCDAPSVSSGRFLGARVPLRKESSITITITITVAITVAVAIAIAIAIITILISITPS